MGCAASRLRSRVDVRDLESSVRTGDLVLFSSKHASAQITKCFTVSEWDHIGLVVKFSSKHVYILEYAGGVYLYPLFTRLYTYYAIQGRELSLRRLLPGQDREEMQQKVEAFVRSVLGHSPPSIQEMVMAVLKQETVISNFINNLAGGVNAIKGDGDGDKDAKGKPAAERRHEDDLQTLFCSKLIAAVYKEIGLLAPHRISSDFLPKHFSQQYDGYLDLQKGALLGPELPINFESVKDEIAALQARVEAERRFKPEELVRAASEFWLNAQKGVETSLGGGLKGIGGSFTHLQQGVSDTFYKLERGLHGYSADAERAMEQEAGKAGAAAYPPIQHDPSEVAAPTGGGRAGDGSPSSITEYEAERINILSGATSPDGRGAVEVHGGSSLVQSLMDTQDGGIFAPSSRTSEREGLLKGGKKERV